MQGVIISKNPNQLEWKEELERLEPSLRLHIYPDVPERDAIEFALAWKPELGVFSEFPNIKWISSTGAGVDHILKDDSLSSSIKITRIVDTFLTEDMTTYLVSQVLNHIRGGNTYNVQQMNSVWIRHPYKSPREITVGIMGLGELGANVAQQLLHLGFAVNGWSNSTKNIAGVVEFVGKDEYSDFLKELDIIICLLPLTPQTKNILDRSTFKHLPNSAYLINVARGEHLVEEDLIEALDGGMIAGACLDVFSQEPLPEEHPFWTHPKISITPHIASITNFRSVVPQIIENYQRLQNEQALLNEVSRDKGY